MRWLEYSFSIFAVWFLSLICVPSLSDISDIFSSKSRLEEKKLFDAKKKQEQMEMLAALKKYPSTGLLVTFEPVFRKYISHCAGVFIGSNTLVTSVHCLPRDKKHELRYFKIDEIDLGIIEQDEFFFNRGVKPIRVIHESSTVLEALSSEFGISSPALVFQDIAILIFKEDIAPGIAPLLGRSPIESEDVIFIGFGNRGQNDDFNSRVFSKRIGYNNILLWPYGIKPFFGAIFIGGEEKGRSSSYIGQKSLTTYGDSGGALFVGEAVAGIACGGDQIQALKMSSYLFEDNSFSIFADLSTPFAKNLFKKAQRLGARIGQK